MVMSGVGGDIFSWYGIIIGKGIKCGFNIRVCDSVGWDIGRVIGSGVIIYIGNEVGSGDNGGVKFEVEGEIDSENDSSVIKDVRYGVDVIVKDIVGQDVDRDVNSEIDRFIVVEV